MSDTDSFIEEVTEEVRRDRLFAWMKRYGWMVIGAVIIVVGGAGFIEYRKAQATAQYQALVTLYSRLWIIMRPPNEPWRLPLFMSVMWAGELFSTC